MFRSNEQWKEFVDAWAITEDCALVRWCRAQNVTTTREGRREFLKRIRKKPASARFAHYHIGFIVHERIRWQWSLAAARSPIQALKMLETDATLSDRQISMLKQSIMESDAPDIIPALESLKLPERAPYNKSKISEQWVKLHGFPN